MGSDVAVQLASKIRGRSEHGVPFLRLIATGLTGVLFEIVAQLQLWIVEKAWQQLRHLRHDSCRNVRRRHTEGCRYGIDEKAHSDSLTGARSSVPLPK